MKLIDFDTDSKKVNSGLSSDKVSKISWCTEVEHDEL